VQDVAWKSVAAYGGKRLAQLATPGPHRQLVQERHGLWLRQPADGLTYVAPQVGLEPLQRLAAAFPDGVCDYTRPGS
jgi:hypothetical protein